MCFQFFSIQSLYFRNNFIPNNRFNSFLLILSQTINQIKFFVQKTESYNKLIAKQINFQIVCKNRVKQKEIQFLNEFN